MRRRKKTARHRHHHVPDELRHGKRHFESPKLHPPGQPETPRDLYEFCRNRAQGLVEAECHVPGLARKDRKDIAKMAANSAASTRPGAGDMKKTTVTETKPRIGTD